jgi:hypothetical protein
MHRQVGGDAMMPSAVLRLAVSVARRYGVLCADDLLGRSRQPTVVAARHELWRLTKDSWGLSYPETAAIFGVDHTSVLYACGGGKRFGKARLHVVPRAVAEQTIAAHDDDDEGVGAIHG